MTKHHGSPPQTHAFRMVTSTKIVAATRTAEPACADDVARLAGHGQFVAVTTAPQPAGWH
jgi:hypothetical protein